MARISPARAHFMRVTAAKQQPATEAVAPAHANQYELMLAQLAEHKRRLKQVQSIERKIEVKRELLPEYEPWVQGVLAGGSGKQDDVLMTILVWYIDIGSLSMALPIAAYALKHGLTLPDQYKRNVACLLAEEAAEFAIKQPVTTSLSQQAAAVPGGLLSPEEVANLAEVDKAIHAATLSAALLQIDELTRDRDMPDEVRAKLHKAIGYSLTEADKPAALEHLQRALQLHDKVGVKKDIEKLERELKNAAPAGSSEGQPGAPGV